MHTTRPSDVRSCRSIIAKKKEDPAMQKWLRYPDAQVAVHALPLYSSATRQARIAQVTAVAAVDQVTVM